MLRSSREEQNVSFCLHLLFAIPPFINNMLQLGTLMLVKLKNCFLFGIQGPARQHEKLEHVTLSHKKKLKACSLGLAANLPFNK